MAELTPNTALVLFGILSSSVSLAHLADEVNRNITHLYRYSLANKANIVATDYFLGNDIIDVAIQTNLRKTPWTKMSASRKLQNFLNIFIISEKELFLRDR